MKAHLTKVSLALLSTVFLLGCQDLGSEPVGPEGPQFDRPLGNCEFPDAGDHCHGDDEDTQLFKVDVTSTAGHISADPQDAKLGSGGGIVANGFTLDLKTFVEGKLTCGGDTPQITGAKTGTFVLVEPASNGPRRHDFASFQFTHNGIAHQLALRGTITDREKWPPATGETNSMTELPEGDGRWIVDASGKDHNNGCTGEGGGLDDGSGIVFTATVLGL